MRVLVVLLAYACAALCAPLLMIAYGALQEGLSGDFSISVSAVVIGLFAAMAAIYALPVALPVIAFTEFRKRGDWKVFALAGVALGTTMTVLFTEVPFSPSRLADAAPFLPLVFACVMTYWLVAWKWLAPAHQADSAQ